MVLKILGQNQSAVIVIPALFLQLTALITKIKTRILLSVSVCQGALQRIFFLRYCWRTLARPMVLVMMSLFKSQPRAGEYSLPYQMI